MKKLLFSVITMAVMAATARASEPLFVGNLVNGGVCVSTQPQVDLNNFRVSGLAIQTVVSSGVYAASTFTDGRSSTASITVVSTTAFTAVAATNSITFASNAALAPIKSTDTITVISTQSLTGVILTINGVQIVAGRDYAVTTVTGTAENLKNIVDVVTGVDAARTAGVIFATATKAGLGGNAFTVTSSSASRLSVATPNFTGGRENALTDAVITINGIGYVNGYLWKSLDAQGIDNSTEAAKSLSFLLTNLTGIISTHSASVIFTTATVAGSAGNAFTITSSTPAVMTVTTPNYTGGRSTATLTINGVALINGVAWATGGTSSATAQNISNAIAANTTLNKIISSTWNVAGVVTSTSITIGTGTNYPIVTNTTALTLSATSYTGGATPAWTVNTPTITITNHGYPLAAPVLYSIGVIPIGGLTNQTTYFVIPVDTNNLKLASTSTGAVAGAFITLTSSSTLGQHTYTLTPQVITGNMTYKYQVSNNALNWSDIAVSSSTFAPPYASTSTFIDFGTINGRYVRINVVAPTTGCVNLQALGNGKQ